MAAIENEYRQFLIKLTIPLPYDIIIVSWVFMPEKWKTYIHTKACTEIVIAALFVIVTSRGSPDVLRQVGSTAGVTSIAPNTTQQYRGMNHWYMKRFGGISRELCWVKNPIPKSYRLCDSICHSWNEKITEMGNNLGTKGMAGGRKKDVLIRGKHGDRRDDSVQGLDCSGRYTNLHMW